MPGAPALVYVCPPADGGCAASRNARCTRARAKDFVVSRPCELLIPASTAPRSAEWALQGSRADVLRRSVRRTDREESTREPDRRPDRAAQRDRGRRAARRGRSHDLGGRPVDGRRSTPARPCPGRRTSTRPTPRPSEAFTTWGRTTPAERQLALLRLADAIEQRADEFVAVESPQHRQAAAPDRHRRGAARASTSCGSSPAPPACSTGSSAGEYMAGHTSWVRREPVGVVGQVDARGTTR